MGDHGEEKDQSISVDQGVWLKLRPDEPSEEEYICFDAYVGDALPDPGLPDRGHHGICAGCKRNRTKTVRGIRKKV